MVSPSPCSEISLQWMQYLGMRGEWSPPGSIQTCHQDAAGQHPWVLCFRHICQYQSWAPAVTVPTGAQQSGRAASALHLHTPSVWHPLRSGAYRIFLLCNTLNRVLGQLVLLLPSIHMKEEWKWKQQSKPNPPAKHSRCSVWIWKGIILLMNYPLRRGLPVCLSAWHTSIPCLTEAGFSVGCSVLINGSTTALAL